MDEITAEDDQLLSQDFQNLQDQPRFQEPSNISLMVQNKPAHLKIMHLNMK